MAERIKLSNKMHEPDRKGVLLRAALELLEKQRTSRYVLDLLSETVRYDDADCDGYCLCDDIKRELEIE